MKILLFTDVHAEKAPIDKVVKKAQSCDIIVCCGDTAIFGEGLKRSIAALKKANKTMLIIHGNHETAEDVEKLCDGKKTIFLHKTFYTYKNILFFAFGGDGFSFENEELEAWIAVQQDKIAQEKKKHQLVFFTHAPPYGTKLDTLPTLGHRGSYSIRKAIKLLQPTLFACGHFHEPFYEQDTLDDTQLINPGPEGTILEL